MKVYVITKGEYSDYHICAVTTDEETAEKLAEKYSDSYDEALIEEFDTDHAEMSLTKKKIFYCAFDPNDSNNSEITISDTGSWEGITSDFFIVREYRNNVLCVNVNADTEEEALKIASDKFAKYRAEKMNL